MSEYSELVERLLAWSETPHEGDPMIDALLCDVPAAGRAIEALMRKVEASEEIIRRLSDTVLMIQKMEE